MLANYPESRLVHSYNGYDIFNKRDERFRVYRVSPVGPSETRNAVARFQEGAEAGGQTDRQKGA